MMLIFNKIIFNEYNPPYYCEIEQNLDLGQ